ncbi:MAG: D-alanyl-D-alanine carboxypeptidase [Clostridia bacterium]|nr:D-alanyl-D-alanine carboxypeptidase [Clostridia bacterium]
MDTVRNGAFGLTNTNRLIRFYKGANGLKTGYTSSAGFCISATAKRDDMQLIAVVMASPTSNERNATAVRLLDYGFANYELFKSEQPQLCELAVLAGKQQAVPLSYGDLSMVLEKGQGKRVEVTVELPERLVAPVAAGQVVGKISWTLDGKELGCADITAKESVKRLTVLDLFVKLFRSYTLF